MQVTVLTSIFNQFRDEFRAHVRGDLPPAKPVLIVELLDICDETGDHRHPPHQKQPDWSYRTGTSGSAPADLRSRYWTTAPPATNQVR
jgi:hypothetical protein